MTDAYVVPAPQEQEPEMSKVREIFDRALNALVEASSLAKTVEQLRVDLEGLKVQVTHYRNTISNQDDQITRLRQDRDAARTAQYQAEDNTRHLTNDLENSKREVDSLSSANSRLNDRITEVTKERDDAQFKLLELQEAHSALSKKMDDIKSHMQSLFNIAEKAAGSDNPSPPSPQEVVTAPPPTPVAYPEEQPKYPETSVEWPHDIR